MHPYKNLPDRAYWKKSISDMHPTCISSLVVDFPNFREKKIATAGSCFAQHIGKALQRKGLNYMDLEPPPREISESKALAFGYLTYSCRYGNIYSVGQLLQLFLEAFSQQKPVDYIWERGGRFFDAMRPSIEPNGFSSREEVEVLRSEHLESVREMFLNLDIFVFTLGLTEGWVSNLDGTIYPSAPGVIAGVFEPEKVSFKNFRYREVYDDLRRFIELLRGVNPACSIVLTISPVPLVATASANHVLVASTYSKAVLRSVAEDITSDIDGVYYFPSFEIISSHPYRAMFFDNNMRTVSQAGVDHVMKLFFDIGEFPDPHPDKISDSTNVTPVYFKGGVNCDDELIDKHLQADL